MFLGCLSGTWIPGTTIQIPLRSRHDPVIPCVLCSSPWPHRKPSWNRDRLSQDQILPLGLDRYYRDCGDNRMGPLCSDRGRLIEFPILVNGLENHGDGDNDHSLAGFMGDSGMVNRPIH